MANDVWIKNRHGRVVQVSPEKKVYLLADHGIRYDDKGRPVKIPKQECERGFSEPTAAEIEQAEIQQGLRKPEAASTSKNETRRAANQAADEGVDTSGDDDGTGEEAPARKGGKFAKK